MSMKSDMSIRSKIKQAVILVGGEGTRLRPLTFHLPKSLVPILNVPFLFWMLNWLAKYGITKIILSAGYLSNQLSKFCKDATIQLGINIVDVIEPKPLGTAGAIKFAEKYLDKEFLVFNGDIFTQFNLNEFVNTHHKNNALITIAVTSVDNPSQYGVVERQDLLGKSGRIIKFLEKPSTGQTLAREINAGVYVIKKEALNGIQIDTRVSIEREVFPSLLLNGATLFAHSLEKEYWIDIGTYDKYRKVHWDLLPKAASLLSINYNGISDPPLQELGKGILGGNNSKVSSTHLAPPIVIGGSVKIAKDAFIGPDVVIGSGSVIEERCIIRKSILWERCKISKGAVLDGVIMGDDCSVASGIELKDVVSPANTCF